MLRDTTSYASLNEFFAELRSQRMTFDVVVIVAHSNALGKVS
jgi:hypothetical protein